MPNTIGAIAASNNPLFTKIAISKISEILVSSPAIRSQFTKNPTAYFQKQFGHAPNAAESEMLKNWSQQIANGWCCGGCACGVSDRGAIAERGGG